MKNEQFDDGDDLDAFRECEGAMLRAAVLAVVLCLLAALAGLLNA